MKGILRAIGYFAVYLVLTLFFQMLLSAVFMGAAAAGGVRDENLISEFANHNILGITLLSGILTILAFFLIFKLRKKDIKDEWRLRRFHPKDLVLPIIMSVSYSFLFALLTYDTPMDNSVMISNSVEYYSGLFPMLGILMMAINLLVIAPAAEELVLRGVVYTRAEKTSNPIAAMIISSLLFGFMHLSAGGFVLVIGSFLMGAVFGYIFYRYGSLWICTISHAAANLPDFILSGHNEMSKGLVLGLEIACAVIFAVSVFITARTKKSSDQQLG